MKCPNCGKSLWFVKDRCVFCDAALGGSARTSPNREREVSDFAKGTATVQDNGQFTSPVASQENVDARRDLLVAISGTAKLDQQGVVRKIILTRRRCRLANYGDAFFTDVGLLVVEYASFELGGFGGAGALLGGGLVGGALESGLDIAAFNKAGRKYDPDGLQSAIIVLGRLLLCRAKCRVSS